MNNFIRILSCSLSVLLSPDLSILIFTEPEPPELFYVGWQCPYTNNYLTDYYSGWGAWGVVAHPGSSKQVPQHKECLHHISIQSLELTKTYV